MSPEEKAVRMMLLDYPQEQQEFYRDKMEELLNQFRNSYEALNPTERELYVAALSIAMTKFANEITEGE